MTLSGLLSSLRSGLPSSTRALWSDRRGGALIYVAFLAIPLTAAAGLAIDASRAYLVKARLGQAVDAAALAGARGFQDDHRDEDIRKYFNSNFPENFMGAELSESDPQIAVDGSAGTVTVDATVDFPTTIMRLLGFQTITIDARAVVHRQSQGLELALVMDNTGSMRSGGKMDAMKTAATDLVEKIYAGSETIENLWVALVPYAATVNIGSDRTEWLNLYHAAANPQGYDAARYAPTTWKGCVQARQAPHDQNDSPPPPGSPAGTAPNALRWEPHLWESTLPFFGGNGDNDWDPTDPSTIDETNAAENDGTGPNLGCGPAITPLVAERSTVIDAIDEMEPWHRGGTMANLGLAWGWRTLSPRWRGLWGAPSPADSPVEYDDPEIQKVIVLLTDGENQWYDWPGGEPDLPVDADYTAYRRLSEEILGNGINGNGPAETEINDRMTTLCGSIKSAGIVIYTILFQVNDEPTEDLYRTCANSDEHFFDAQTNGALTEAFDAIGEKLAKLRIAE